MKNNKKKLKKEANMKYQNKIDIEEMDFTLVSQKRKIPQTLHTPLFTKENEINSQTNKIILSTPLT